MRQRLNPVKTKTPSEKIRTGQSFLYRKNGFESMVLEIQLKKNIDCQPLTEAFRQAIDRFDYLSQRLISEAGDFFLVSNPKPFIIRNDTHFLPLGGLEVNDHLLDIHYLGHTLYIAYHHAICDGRGILPFVRTFLYYYLKGNCQLSPIVPDIQLSGSPFLRGETTEPALPNSLAGEAMPTIHKNGFSLPEAQDQTQRLSYSYLFQIKLDSTSMMTYARSLKASPATLLASLFSETIQQIHPRNKQAILCNLVTDLRGASQQLSQTSRNCVSSLPLAYPQKACDRQELVKDYRQRIGDFKGVVNLQAELKKVLSLSDHLDSLPSFAEKQAFLAFYETLLSDTYILSYIGQLQLGALEDHIQAIHTYTSGTRGLSIEVLALADGFYLDIMQSFPTTTYVDHFLSLLASLGITVESTSVKKVSVPKDKIQQRLGIYKKTD